MEGMIVKTGLQDVTKNVRIYGTISAASSPSVRLPYSRRRRLYTADAPRDAFSRAPFPTVRASSPRPRSDLLLHIPLPAVVLISSPPPPPPCRAARLCLSDPLLPTTPYSLLCHPYSIAPLGIRSGGAPPLVGRAGKQAQRGAITPTAAGTTLMLH